jgi:nucleoside-diphosphate-sugar epimerase
MNIVVTGGAGFLGRRLVQRLLKDGALAGVDGRPRTIDRITVVDVVAADDLPQDPRLAQVVGDISDRALMGRVIDGATSSVFHLAAIVSGMAEADFELGMRINVDASRLILEACRKAGHGPKLVFASSVAVYGGAPSDTMHDTTAVAPRTSYGTQKAIVELLINDYSRRGFVDGRVLRLPTISVRPGRPNAAASSFASGIIREPLNGEPAVCPVDPDTRLLLLSPTSVIGCMIHGHDMPAEALGGSRIVNLPGLTVSVGEMAAALERVAGREVAARIRWEPDPRIAKMVATWPGAWDSSRALALGFPGDRSFEAIIRSHIEERGQVLN